MKRSASRTLESARRFLVSERRLPLLAEHFDVSPSEGAWIMYQVHEEEITASFPDNVLNESLPLGRYSAMHAAVMGMLYGELPLRRLPVGGGGDILRNDYMCAQHLHGRHCAEIGAEFGMSKQGVHYVTKNVAHYNYAASLLHRRKLARELEERRLDAEYGEAVRSGITAGLYRRDVCQSLSISLREFKILESLLTRTGRIEPTTTAARCRQKKHERRAGLAEEILSLRKQSLTNKEISERLDIPRQWVAQYCSDLRAKGVSVPDAIRSDCRPSDLWSYERALRSGAPVGDPDSIGSLSLPSQRVVEKKLAAEGIIDLPVVLSGEAGSRIGLTQEGADRLALLYNAGAPREYIMEQANLPCTWKRLSETMRTMSSFKLNRPNRYTWILKQADEEGWPLEETLRRTGLSWRSLRLHLQKIKGIKRLRSRFMRERRKGSSAA